MQRSQAQQGHLFSWEERVDQASAFAKFRALISRLWEKRARAEDEIAARYDGRAWCDSTEHELTHDIVTGVHPRF